MCMHHMILNQTIRVVILARRAMNFLFSCQGEPVSKVLDGVCSFVKDAEEHDGRILFVSEAGTGRGESRAVSCLAGCLVERGMTVQDAIHTLTEAAGAPTARA
jgi:hypothetical protein